MKTNSEALQRVQMVLAAAMADQQCNENELLTMAEACAKAKVSRWTISRWIRNGYIRAVKLGKAKSSPVRIIEGSLLAYLTSLEVQTNNRTEVEK